MSEEKGRPNREGRKKGISASTTHTRTKVLSSDQGRKKEQNAGHKDRVGFDGRVSLHPTFRKRNWRNGPEWKDWGGVNELKGRKRKGWGEKGELGKKTTPLPLRKPKRGLFVCLWMGNAGPPDSFLRECLSPRGGCPWSQY